MVLNAELINSDRTGVYACADPMKPLIFFFGLDFGVLVQSWRDPVYIPVYLASYPGPSQKKGEGLAHAFPYTTVKLLGARVKQRTRTYTERSVLPVACIYEIENALQDLRVSSGHKTFKHLFFCPWHEPRLAYTHKSIRELPLIFSNFRKSVNDGGGKEYTFTTGGLTRKAHPRNKADVYEQSTDIIYSKVRSYTNPIKTWDSFAHAQTVYTRPSPFFWEGPGYEDTVHHNMCIIHNTSSMNMPICLRHA